MKKLYRPHRGMLADSLSEAKEVGSLADIRPLVDEYFKNLRIDPQGTDDSDRAGEEWSDTDLTNL